MMRIKILFIVCFGFSVNLFAENHSIILQEKDQQSNLFITGEFANSIYELLKMGVPEESLPNGSSLEGGNIACSKLAGFTNEKSVVCSFRIAKDGLTKDETPTFMPSISAVDGTLEVKEMKTKGFMQLIISGDIGSKLFHQMSVLENKEGLKVGKNILCRKKELTAECSTNINERGFADFPEEKLSSMTHSNLAFQFRGDK